MWNGQAFVSALIVSVCPQLKNLDGLDPFSDWVGCSQEFMLVPSLLLSFLQLGVKYNVRFPFFYIRFD